MTKAVRRDQPVYEITGTQLGLHDDQASRTRRYLLSMGLRTACFILAVATHGWLRWTLVFGAVALPYFAVIFANVGRDKATSMPRVVVHDVRPQIEGPAVRLPEQGTPTSDT